MVTVTEAIERSPTDCDEGTYSAPTSTNCCRPLQTPFSQCQESQDTGRYRGLFTSHSFMSREWPSDCADVV